MRVVVRVVSFVTSTALLFKMYLLILQGGGGPIVIADWGGGGEDCPPSFGGPQDQGALGDRPHHLRQEPALLPGLSNLIILLAPVGSKPFSHNRL